MTRIEFGEKIRCIRKSKGFSQEYLALKCGVSYPRIYELETGRKNTGIDLILRIFDVLDINLQLPDDIEKQKTNKRLG